MGYCVLVPQSLNVPYTGKEPVLAGSGWVGEMLRFASRHCRLTISPVRTNVASLIRDAVRLAAASLGRPFEHLVAS
jgi:alkanesulfonate monooxygenase SsuD/methylene tetrahydromethanopterin reductase-like flavin-dependent oxidoreductase (luciferase family)